MRGYDMNKNVAADSKRFKMCGLTVLVGLIPIPIHSFITLGVD
jgi:hypothetical protein